MGSQVAREPLTGTEEAANVAVGTRSRRNDARAAVAAVAGGFAAASCCAACDSPNRSSGVFRRATKNTSASAWDISPPSGITASGTTITRR